MTSIFKSFSKKKGRKAAESTDSFAQQEPLPKKGSRASMRRSPVNEQRKSGDFNEAFRRPSTNSTRTPRDAPPPAGGGPTSPIQRGGSARGISSPEPRQQSQPSSNQQQQPRSPGGFRSGEDEQEEDTDEFGIPSEWAQKPSRQRRFTAHTRPDLHQGAEEVDEADFAEREKNRELLESTLEEMEDIVNEQKRVADEEEEEGAENEKNEDDDAMPPPKSPKRNSKRQSRRRFVIPGEFEFRFEAYKRGRGLRKNWKLRMFHLDTKRRRLTYYSPSSMTELGSISLDYIRVEIVGGMIRHSNSKIDSRFEFHVIENGAARGGRHLGIKTRKLELCATSEEDYEGAAGRLQIIEQIRAEFSKSNPKKVGGKSLLADEEEEEDHTAKWDEAQNWTAHGKGLYEARIGEPVRFTIQANDEFGERCDHVSVVPNVTLVSEDLHFDVGVVDNEDGTFTGEYVVTSLANFELSILLDGFDIYGSPYYPRILPGGVRATHCTADGMGLLCALLDQPNVFTIYPKNEFDEPVEIDEEDTGNGFIIEMEKPLVLESVEKNDDASYKVTYKVDCTTAELRKLQSESDCLAGYVKVSLDDGRHRVKRDDGTETSVIIPQIRGSPFKPGISVSLNPEDLAAAYTAAEFSKLIQENLDSTGALRNKSDLKNPFVVFSQALRSSGMLNLPLPDSTTEKNVGEAQEDNQQMHVAVPPPVGNGGARTPLSTGSTGEPSTPSSEFTSTSLAGANHSYFQVNGTSPPTQQQQQQPPQPQYVSPPRQHQQQAVQAQQTFPPPQVNRNEWIPHEQEVPLVRESLEERARQIELEKQELIRKRQELDASRNLIDEQVRRMAEIGQKVQVDSEKMIERARLAERNPSPDPSPLRYAVKENLVDPNQRSIQNFDQGRKMGSSSSSTGGAVVLDKPLITLFDKHSLVLSRVFEFYKMGTSLQLSDMVKLCQDYDITPTFISRKEIREIFGSVTRHEDVHSLSYESFVEMLANIAVHSLSKPMFAHLYSTNLSKVNVLLTMWGLADPIKLSEIQQETKF